MARMRTTGLQVVAEDMASMSRNDREAALRGLENAAEQVAELIKESAERHKLRDTGQLIESIKPGPLVAYSDSATIDIWPQGTRETRHGRKTNAVVGFVQHYGRRYKLSERRRGKYSPFSLTKEGDATYRRGTYFFDTAYVMARQEKIAVKCIAKELDEIK